MRVVFLNGPPGCGKDTAVSHLVQYIKFTHLKFAAPIKRAVCGLLNEDIRWLEENKDQPHRSLRLDNGAAIASTDTPRQLLIALSEDLLKKRYGEEFFGYVMVNEIRKSANKLVIISDSGFRSEAFPVVRQLGPPNCIKFEIFRPGRSFDGDSRSYWSIPGVLTKTIRNDSTIHDLTMAVLYGIIKQWPSIELLKEPMWIK